MSTEITMADQTTIDGIRAALQIGQVQLVATVASASARKALTGLALNDIVKQTDSDPGSYWRVIDAAQLASDAGWVQVEAVDWADITSKPIEAAGLAGNYVEPPEDEDLTLNPFAGLTETSGGGGSFPVTGQTWIVTEAAGVADADGYVSSFRVDLVNAEGGRTVEFYILDPADSYRVKYASGSQAAASAGVKIYSPSVPVAIASGQVVGVYVNNASTANGIRYGSSSGPDVIGAGAQINGPLTEGSTYSPSAQPAQRQFFVGAEVISKALLVGRQWANKPGGYVGVDESGFIDVGRVPEMRWRDKKIIWVGTSIPAGNSPSYPAQAGEDLQANLVNEAAGSSHINWYGTDALSLSATIAELTAAFPGNEGQSYENKLIGKGADLVVFDHGYNDRWMVSAYLGAFDSDRTTFYGAFSYVIEALYADNPSVKIAFVVPPSRYTGAIGAGGASTTATNDALRGAIFAVAAYYGAPIIDLPRLCGFNATNHLLYFPDGIHPSQAATDHIARVLYHALKGV